MKKLLLQLKNVAKNKRKYFIDPNTTVGTNSASEIYSRRAVM